MRNQLFFGLHGSGEGQSGLRGILVSSFITSLQGSFFNAVRKMDREVEVMRVICTESAGWGRTYRVLS